MSKKRATPKRWVRTGQATEAMSLIWNLERSKKKKLLDECKKNLQLNTWTLDGRRDQSTEFLVVRYTPRLTVEPKTVRSHLLVELLWVENSLTNLFWILPFHSSTRQSIKLMFRLRLRLASFVRSFSYCVCIYCLLKRPSTSNAHCHASPSASASSQ